MNGPPPLQIYPLLDHFPEQFLKFLTEHAKCKLFLCVGSTKRLSKLQIQLEKRSKQGQICQGGGPFICYHPVDVVLNNFQQKWQLLNKALCIYLGPKTSMYLLQFTKKEYSKNSTMYIHPASVRKSMSKLARVQN